LASGGAIFTGAAGAAFEAIGAVLVRATGALAASVVNGTLGDVNAENLLAGSEADVLAAATGVGFAAETGAFADVTGAGFAVETGTLAGTGVAFADATGAAFLPEPDDPAELDDAGLLVFSFGYLTYIWFFSSSIDASASGLNSKV